MKAKGSNAERQLVAKFWKHGYASIRVAGSGSSRFPCPDILTSNGKKTLAIEAKATKKEYQYFRRDQIDELIKFSQVFGAEPILAIKFSSSWFFFKIKNLTQTTKGAYTIHKKNAEELSTPFEDLII